MIKATPSNLFIQKFNIFDSVFETNLEEEPESIAPNFEKHTINIDFNFSELSLDNEFQVSLFVEIYPE